MEWRERLGDGMESGAGGEGVRWRGYCGREVREGGRIRDGMERRWMEGVMEVGLWRR